mmetsp:Transcript_9372/g.23372  ORF Transcript_9372/g.23372 Transcript_9372/m.23372 type:complete len:227 (+) Transcript_9372:248-928(+)
MPQLLQEQNRVLVVTWRAHKQLICTVVSMLIDEGLPACDEGCREIIRRADDILTNALCQRGEVVLVLYPDLLRELLRQVIHRDVHLHKWVPVVPEHHSSRVVAYLLRFPRSVLFAELLKHPEGKEGRTNLQIKCRKGCLSEFLGVCNQAVGRPLLHQPLHFGASFVSKREKLFVALHRVAFKPLHHLVRVPPRNMTEQPPSIAQRHVSRQLLGLVLGVLGFVPTHD